MAFLAAWRTSMEKREGFSLGPFAPYVVVSASGMGIGVFSTAFIPPNTVVTAFDGELVTNNTVYGLKTHGINIEPMHTWCNGLQQAVSGKGVGSLLNHSDAPNCAKHELFPRGFGKIIVFKTKRWVYPGEQLTWAYRGTNLDDVVVVPARGASWSLMPLLLFSMMLRMVRVLLRGRNSS